VNSPQVQYDINDSQSAECPDRFDCQLKEAVYDHRDPLIPQPSNWPEMLDCSLKSSVIEANDKGREPFKHGISADH